ncbi:hypothetical protein sscle_02g021520 [Sclerotinia sclerotiorum 1980 UF-70]|uniref:Mitochondrial inner membrane protease subunit 2 n=1 Tax=Sclerotinia sclerotiorum (strain ATCC 18683 / 1980 / Ss-1) TaxID=665079 RepID=A0A1D9PXV2_SCLS1|nr:hypothetical protein sscle_02g021520 [Sclerotinia sclerotiorum 1980 UF-70]
MSQRLFSALKKGSPIRHFLKEFSYYSLIIVSWIPAVIFFQEHVAALHTIKGASMYPFFNSGYNESQSRDVCLVDKRNPTEGLERGMLVSFRSPYRPENLVVKRIIALEGDRVYTRAPYPYPIADIQAGHVWVEGDNNADARNSLDSNHYGPIAVNLINGKLTRVLWPWGVWGVLGGRGGGGGRRWLGGGMAGGGMAGCEVVGRGMNVRGRNESVGEKRAGFVLCILLGNMSRGLVLEVRHVIFNRVIEVYM